MAVAETAVAARVPVAGAPVGSVQAAVADRTVEMVRVVATAAAARGKAMQERGALEAEAVASAAAEGAVAVA